MAGKWLLWNFFWAGMAEQHLAGFNLHLFHAAISSVGSEVDFTSHPESRAPHCWSSVVFSPEIVQVSTLPPPHLAGFLNQWRSSYKIICDLVIIPFISYSKSWAIFFMKWLEWLRRKAVMLIARINNCWLKTVNVKHLDLPLLQHL